jgi:replicative DNA helicase
MSAMPSVTPTPAVSATPAQRVEIAERAVLGKLLQLGRRNKAQADYERVEHLEPIDFTKPIHVKTWEAMKAIAARHDNLNITTVEDQMSKSLGRAIEKTGRAYLYSLLDGQYGDVVDSAKIIRRASWRRKVKAEAQALVTMADNDTLTEDQIMEQTNDKAERITQAGIALTGKTGISLHESVGMLHDRVQVGMSARENEGEVLYYGIRTGLKAIDDVTQGLQPGEVTVVAGKTGTGKSAFAIKVAKNAMQTGSRVCFVPLEMTHLQMTQRFMAIETRIHGTAIKTANIPSDDMPRFIEACHRIQGYEMSHQFTYLSLEPRPNIHQLKAKLIAHINLYSPQLVVIDQVSIEAMSGTHPRLDEKQIIGEIMVELKALAEKYRIHFLILAQLNRAGSGQDGQRPILNNLANSSSVEKAAQTVIFLYRETALEQKPIEPVEFIFAKNRDGWQGTKYGNFIPALTDYVDAP